MLVEICLPEGELDLSEVFLFFQLEMIVNRLQAWTFA